MKDEDFDRYPDVEGSQQVGPVLRRHTEVKSQEESKDTGDGEYNELNCVHHPASVTSKIADCALDIKS
jgi:hypothetical protein